MVKLLGTMREFAVGGGPHSPFSPSPIHTSWERGDPGVLDSAVVGVTAPIADRSTQDRPFAYACGIGEGEG